MRLGLTLSCIGHRPMASRKAFAGYSPAAILPPPVREGDGIVQAGGATRPTDHMNPASSRATVVHNTVVRFPVALSLRYRAVRRDGAFQAISRTAGDTR